MNLTKLYERKMYVIDTNNFYFVKIIDERKDSWTEGRAGEIFVTFKPAFFDNAVLYFPQLLLNLFDKGLPVISTRTTRDSSGEVVYATGRIIRRPFIFQKPINWEDYLEAKKSSPEEITAEYARAYNNSLYDK